MPLSTLRLHARQYICSDFVFLALCRTSRVVVRAFHRASSEKSFPPSPSLCLADKCAAAVNSFICSLYLYCSLAPLLLLLLLSCSLCLTTDPPVTQFNFHSFRLCMLHTPIYTLCVSFLIPHHPLVSLLRCIEYSVEQQPRLLQHLQRRQDVGREEV